MLTAAGSPMSDAWHPRVVQGFHWREMDGAYTVSRDGDSRAHVLNHTGVLLLELANGRHSVDEMIEIVQTAFQLTRVPDGEVRQFLQLAAQAGLVE